MTPDHKSVNTPHEEVKGHACIKMTSSFYIIYRRLDFWKIFEIFYNFAGSAPLMTPDQIFSRWLFVKGLKLSYVHESRDHAIKSVGEAAFLVKITFWPCDLWMTSNPTRIMCSCVPPGVGYLNAKCELQSCCRSWATGQNYISYIGLCRPWPLTSGIEDAKRQ